MSNHNYRLRLFVKQYLKVVQRRKELGLPYDAQYLRMIEQMVLMQSNPEVFEVDKLVSNLTLNL